MKLVYPTENEVMKFFEQHSGFKTVIRISELLICKYHSNLQDKEWKHVWAILHSLKRDNFLIVKNEGKNVLEEEFSSTPDRVIRYFEKQILHDVGNLQDKTDEQLKEIMRFRIENQNLPHSIYHKARQELEFRRQNVSINNGIIAQGSVTAGENLIVGSSNNVEASLLENNVWKVAKDLLAVLAAVATIASAIFIFYQYFL